MPAFASHENALGMGRLRGNKRGIKGVYQHCAERNLNRYLAEFDFRYNTRKITNSERAVLAVRGGEGKRLTYRQLQFFLRCAPVFALAAEALLETV